MSLGENLQFLRKRDGITQEQLAEKLDVSRQSVSKWESDTSYPEMDKLLQLCQMFHCTMDDLVQGSIHNIHTEGKTDYDNQMNKYSKTIALSVGTILMGVAFMFLAYGINFFLGNTEVIKEDFITIIFLIFLTIAVAVIVVSSIQHSDFIKKNPVLDYFYTEKEIDEFNKKFSVLITAGITIILIGIIIIVGSEAIYPGIESNEYLESLMSFVFLTFIAFGVTIIVYAAMMKNKYNIEQYNAEHNKESDVYKKGRLLGTINGCIILFCTIIYLSFGFIKNGWGMPFVLVYAIGGILCAIISMIVNYKK